MDYNEKNKIKTAMKTINFNIVSAEKLFDKSETNNPTKLPEICFAGRSNVGKSSLINCLLNKKKLASISNKPGHTKNIFFYNIDASFILVDLPGYGYAKLSKKKKFLISNLLFNYLTSKNQIKNVFVLIDSRHGLKNNDLDFLKMLNFYNLNFGFLFTKIDKLTYDKKEELKLKGTKEKIFENKKNILISSKTKEGIKELRTEIINLSK